MEKGKKYVSDWKGLKYNIFISPNDKMDAYSVSIYNGDKYIGAVNGLVNNVQEGLKKASKIIVSYHKNRNNTSSVEGTETKNKGSIKLAWLDNDKTDSVLHSQTFDSVQEALKNVTKDKKKWFIFKSINLGNETSSWELLPYGNYKDYSRGVNVTSNFLVKTGVVVLCALGTYFVFTKIKPFIFKS